MEAGHATPRLRASPCPVSSSALPPSFPRLHHAAEHACFLFTAVLFWTAVVRSRADGRVGPLRSAGRVLATMIQGGLLGALITRAPRTLYPRYDLTAPVRGLTGLEDQQLAGLIMWVPAGLVHLMAGLALVASWIRETGRRTLIRAADAG